jgi:RNA polymerase sigma-70 factor (ECF subfamily)
MLFVVADPASIIQIEVIKTVQSAPLEMLWYQFSSRLLAFIRRRVSDNADAEDILQEVFIRVHRGLCCSNEWNKPESWIYQITRNLIIDYYRRRRNWAEIPEDLAVEADIPEGDPEKRLALSLRETIDQLPEPYRQALILTEYQGLSQKELAEKLGLSTSGAKSRIQRARQAARSFISLLPFRTGPARPHHRLLSTLLLLQPGEIDKEMQDADYREKRGL